MTKPEWGVKRYCGGCGARFYDMRRDPIVCPKCGVEHDPLGQARPARPKTVAVAAKAEAKPKPKPVDTDLDLEESDDDDILIDDDEEIDDPEEESEDDEAIEDASELGEDEDDMFEVMDKVEGKKEEEA